MSGNHTFIVHGTFGRLLETSVQIFIARNQPLNSILEATIYSSNHERKRLKHCVFLGLLTERIERFEEEYKEFIMFKTYHRSANGVEK